MVSRRRAIRSTLLMAVALVGCATTPPALREEPPTPAIAPPSVPEAKPPAAAVRPSPGIVARDDAFVVYRTSGKETYRSLARRFLGSAERDWQISEFPGNSSLAAGREVVIPLQPLNPVGVYPDGYQTVPVLCYHRFGDGSAKMVVSPEAFAEQMEYLARNGYRVVPLTEVAEFLAGRNALPRKAVAITMDDGYRSNYLHAYPVLKRHRFPATIFLYTDFLGGGAALRTDEMREMLASGLVDIQPHSKAHSNLALPAPGEDEAAYDRRLEAEVLSSAERIRSLLGVPIHTFAYPYGDADRQVVALLEASGYRLGATVQAGGNPAFAPPFLLRRTMVYGGDDLNAFQEKLDVFQRISRR